MFIREQERISKGGGGERDIYVERERRIEKEKEKIIVREQELILKGRRRE